MFVFERQFILVPRKPLHMKVRNTEYIEKSWKHSNSASIKGHTQILTSIFVASLASIPILVPMFSLRLSVRLQDKWRSIFCPQPNQD